MAKKPKKQGIETNTGVTGISRREVLKLGGKAALAALAAPAFSPYMFQARAGQAGQPLTFWQFHAPNGPFAMRSKWFEDTVASWNESNEAQIRLEFVPVAEYLGGSRLQTAFASGQGPDIFIISPGDFLRYYNGGVLADLTPYIDEEARNDLFPDVMATRTVDGRIYGLPMEVQPMAMFYSVQAFEEAGLSETDVPATWDELLDVAERLTTNDRYGVAFQTNPGYYQNFTWYPFLWQGGGEMVANDKSAFDSDAAANALKFWQDSIVRGVAPRTLLGTGANDPVANLAGGYCAIQNVGNWAVGAFRENAPDFEYGVFRLPTPAGGNYVTSLGGWAFVANSQGRDPESAARFCAWAIGSMSEDSIERGTDWCIRIKSDLAPRRSVSERAISLGAYDSGPMKTFVEEIFPGGRPEPRVPPEIYRIVSDSIQACQLDGADPVRQAGQASQQIDAFLARYNGAPII